MADCTSLMTLVAGAVSGMVTFAYRFPVRYARTFVLINIACAGAAGFLFGWSTALDHVRAILVSHYNNVADEVPYNLVAAAKIPYGTWIAVGVLAFWLSAIALSGILWRRERD